MAQWWAETVAAREGSMARKSDKSVRPKKNRKQHKEPEPLSAKDAYDYNPRYCTWCGKIDCPTVLHDIDPLEYHK